MFYRKSLLLIIMGSFLGFGCSQNAVVLVNSHIFSDAALSKKLTKEALKRGTALKMEQCENQVCKVKDAEGLEGFMSQGMLYSEDYGLVTVVRNAWVHSEPDLLSPPAKYKKSAGSLAKYLPKEILQGTQGFLLEEKMVWARVDFGDIQGWVLKEKLFKGQGPFSLRTDAYGLSIELKGDWYKPYLSGERLFSLEKAFDEPASNSFSIVQKDQQITVLIKSFMNRNEKFTFSYQPEKKIKFKNLGLPKIIEINHPVRQRLDVSDGFSFAFEGETLRFQIIEADQKWIYLNHLQIKKRDTALKTEVKIPMEEKSPEEPEKETE